MAKIIYPNRWFLWTVTFLIAVGILLILSIRKAALDFEQQAVLNYEAAAWKTLASNALGISVRYPPGWQIEIDQQDGRSVYLENSNDYSENISISVREPQLEPVIRAALRIATEKSVTIDGQKGRWLVGRDYADPATTNVILLAYKDRLYYIAGTAKTFERIVTGIKFIQ